MRFLSRHRGFETQTAWHCEHGNCSEHGLMEGTDDDATAALDAAREHIAETGHWKVGVQIITREHLTIYPDTSHTATNGEVKELLDRAG